MLDNSTYIEQVVFEQNNWIQLKAITPSHSENLKSTSKTKIAISSNVLNPSRIIFSLINHVSFQWNILNKFCGINFKIVLVFWWIMTFKATECLLIDFAEIILTFSLCAVMNNPTEACEFVRLIIYLPFHLITFTLIYKLC